ncbi:MAG: hypothetical protein RL308_107 [Bacteroidota bacterium]|jgi:hypothetical protein
MELTFENWLSGEVELSETYKNRIPKDNTTEYEAYERIIKSIDLFPKKEINKIRASQKDYFIKLSKDYYNLLYNSYQNRYKASDLPIEVLETELYFLEQILEGFWVKKSLNLFSNQYANLIMNENSVSTFSHYVSKIKQRGFEPYYNFMPSPNSKFYDLNASIIPEIYADVLYNLKITLSSHHPNPDQITRIPKEFFKVPKNEYPEIFSNGYAYKVFIIMEETVAVNPGTYNADYTLIYHCLHFPDIQAIRKNVDKLTFADFINSRLGDKTIEVSKMKAATGLDKNMTIRYGIKYYLKYTNFKGDVIKLLNKIKL